jgi:hypothetical protein
MTITGRRFCRDNAMKAQRRRRRRRRKRRGIAALS